MIPRNTFKKVKILNQEYIYPFPVIIDKKYLIELNNLPSKAIIFSLENGLIESPDSTLLYYLNKGTHTDGKTPYYSLDIDKITFNLLSNKIIDPGKASSIERLLNIKIMAVLKNKDNAKNELKKCYEKQLKCSTCKKLGIESIELSKLIELLCEI